MKFNNTLFGNLPDGREARLFTIETTSGLTISISNYGAAITSVIMPDRQGHLEEITAGFPSLEGYLKDHPYFGVITGRFANRIANAQFSINEKKYRLPANSGPSHLHGGPQGFHTKLWDYAISEKPGSVSIHLTYTSPHLEMGYPGNLKAVVSYTVFENNVLQIEFEAQTDAPTHVNLTNHAYFNLSGFRDNVFAHKLFVDADHYLDLDEKQIPTGKILPCAGTTFDYQALNENMSFVREPVDHCFVLKTNRSQDQPAAMLFHPGSGRMLKVFCTQPGIQIYTGNFLDGSFIGHKGLAYGQHQAICLETQHFPDSPNHPGFPSTLLKPGEVYRQTSKFVFETL
ncbi:MAG: galactose mutarotase [Bacteroidales bacterium]|nr:galactose mutarotase [Bacteroidales bacterium]